DPHPVRAIRQVRPDRRLAAEGGDILRGKRTWAERSARIVPRPPGPPGRRAPPVDQRLGPDDGQQRLGPLANGSFQRLVIAIGRTKLHAATPRWNTRVAPADPALKNTIFVAPLRPLKKRCELAGCGCALTV